MRALIFELHGLLADDRLQRARALGEIAAGSSIGLADPEARAAARVDDVRALQRIFTGAGRALTEDGLRRMLAELDERVAPAPLRSGARELVELAAANVTEGMIAGSLQGRA